MLLNASALQGIHRSFKVLFQSAFEGAESRYDLISMTVPSTKKENTYAWLGEFPGMKEWIDERVVHKLKGHGYTIRNRSFESTIEVDREDIEDDDIGIYTPMVQELGRAAKVHPDVLVFGLLKDGWTTPCYDGKAFFATDHVQGDATVSNDGGGSGAPWFLMDLSRAIKPIILQQRKKPEFVAKDKITDDNVFFSRKFVYGVDDRKNVGFGLWQLAYASKNTLSATNYAAARASMMGMRKENKEPLGVRPTHLIVPPTLESPARKLIMNEFLDNGSSNEWKNSVKLEVVEWLA